MTIPAPDQPAAVAAPREVTITSSAGRVPLTIPSHTVTGLEAPDASVIAAQKDDPGTRRMAWVGAIVFGILTVIGAVWLYRKINPQPLTPAAANRPAQPGGAPSD